MRSFIIAFATLLVGLADSPAFATQATWAEGASWEVIGDTDGACILIVRYEGNDNLTVVSGRNGALMGFQSNNIRPFTRRSVEFLEATPSFPSGEHFPPRH